MADREHLKPLIAAIASGECHDWNYWRMTHADLRPDLAAVELRDVKLPFANLSRADLRGADLSGTDLSHADLGGANLAFALLRHTNLSQADLRGANLSHADLRAANLNRANLAGADLTHADLSGANLKGTSLDDIGADRPPGRSGRWLGGGLTLLEKASLGLFKRKRAKVAPVQDTEADRANTGKHL